MTFNDLETNMRLKLPGFSHSSCSVLKKKYYTCCAHSNILDFIEEKLRYFWHFAHIGAIKGIVAPEFYCSHVCCIMAFVSRIIPYNFHINDFYSITNCFEDMGKYLLYPTNFSRNDLFSQKSS